MSAIATQSADASSARTPSADATIAALGPRANTPDEAAAVELGMRSIVAAASEAGVRRIVTLSGAGIAVPGDQ